MEEGGSGVVATRRSDRVDISSVWDRVSRPSPLAFLTLGLVTFRPPFLPILPAWNAAPPRPPPQPYRRQRPSSSSQSPPTAGLSLLHTLCPTPVGPYTQPIPQARLTRPRRKAQASSSSTTSSRCSGAPSHIPPRWSPLRADRLPRWRIHSAETAQQNTSS